MEDYKKYTPTELLKLLSETKNDHEKTKNNIIELTFQVDSLDQLINKNIGVLDSLEKKYIDIIEEINNR